MQDGPRPPRALLPAHRPAPPTSNMAATWTGDGLRQTEDRTDDTDGTRVLRVTDGDTPVNVGVGVSPNLFAVNGGNGEPGEKNSETRGKAVFLGRADQGRVPGRLRAGEPRSPMLLTQLSSGCCGTGSPPQYAVLQGNTSVRYMVRAGLCRVAVEIRTPSVKRVQLT
ncbi:Hypothetical protein SMAX5B_003300 [Scophthalmus maximus]|uniref:Uncharacterized protein n=1 Tax=Scophthalmus maximus TaxID=52904 RepID=A0A2U9CB55_SCOMX|nr:Hypothetical protein SMAX5B_003300 [Scophthalmus maximus]